MIRIGLIGCGKWGRYILRDLKTLGCHVTVVARSEASKQNAHEGNADAVVDSIASLQDVEGIVIATQASKHTDVIVSVAELYPHVPIFVEKPITVNAAEAKMIQDKYGDRVYVMHKWQYHHGILALAEHVRKKTWGQLCGMHLKRFSTANNHPDVDFTWTCMPHDVTIVQEILGYMPELQSAVATQWEQETMALKSCWGNNPWVIIEVSAIKQAKQREVRLEFEKGVAILGDGFAEHFEVYQRMPDRSLSTVPEYLPFKNEMPLYAELEHFIQFIEGGSPPKATAQQGYEVVKAIAQARERAGIVHSGVLL